MREIVGDGMKEIVDRSLWNGLCTLSAGFAALTGVFLGSDIPLLATFHIYWHRALL